MLRKHIAVDLGTANTLVFVQSQGIVINEPSVVAVDTINERVIAVGKEAKDYIGKTPQRISTIRPLRDGVIADFDAAQALIATFLKKVIGSWPIKPDVVICVPTNITDVERRAVAEAATKAGARNVKLIEEPVAAAVGAGLPVLAPVGSMVVDIGGGTTDIAVITLGSMACSTSLKLAGDALTAAVQRFVREKYQIVVGENMAERIKIALGSVAPLPVPLSFEVSGKDLATASPRTIALSDTDTREAFQPITEKLVSAVMGIL
ncbi:MAG: rod shape-determining protein, partial [Bilophila wadsworthia]